MTMNSDMPFRVAVGVDPSDYGRHAAQWAAREASERGGTLTLVHALDLPDGPARLLEPAGHIERRRHEGEALLIRVARRVAERYPDLPVQTVIADLAPTRELVRLSRSVDLLVTGTRGHGGFTGMLLGSVSHRLAAHAHCPIVVIGDEPAGEPRPEVVLAVGRDEPPEPIEFAFTMAASLGLSIRAVRAFQPIATYVGHVRESVLEAREIAAFSVQNVLKTAREAHPDVPVTIEARHGVTVPTLCDAVRGSRLLVAGCRRDRGALGIGPGHVVHGLLSHADTPVAVVPVCSGG